MADGSPFLRNGLDVLRREVDDDEALRRQAEELQHDVWRISGEWERGAKGAVERALDVDRTARHVGGDVDDLDRAVRGGDEADPLGFRRRDAVRVRVER